MAGATMLDGALVRGAQLSRPQSSGGVWSKSTAAVSSSQESTAKAGTLAGTRGGALAGSPMHSRMRLATAGSVMVAITRIVSPH